MNHSTQKEKINIFNLSGISISKAEVSVLSLGTKMVPLTKIDNEEKKVDVLKFSRNILLKYHFHNTNYSSIDLIKPVSTYIPKTVKSHVLKGIIEDLEVFSNELSAGLEKVHKKDNLTIEQRSGLNIFKSRKNILYFKADKGAGVVLLNPEFYRDKVLEILSTDKYEKLPRKIDYFIVCKLIRLVKDLDYLTKNEKRAITKFDYKTTNIYALPKIHKSQIIRDSVAKTAGSYLFLTNPSDLPFRLIFGGPKNPCSGLADLVDVLLKPFLVKVHSRLKDVFDFISKIPAFDPRDLPFIEIISIDVKSMYENLDQSLGIPALRFFLNRYPNLLPSRIPASFVIDAMIFVLENNTGFFNGEFYKQTSGTATGIKPAPTYADLAMGYFETLLFYKLRAKVGPKTAYYFWKYYLRYLDDGIIFWDTRLGNFDDIFAILNNLHPSLTFTIERHKSKLKYLDVLIYKTPTGFKTVVNSKETDSGTYLPFNSAHPRHCKTNIPFNMARRIRALTDDDILAHSKMTELSAMLREGGYPEGMIKSAVKRAMCSTPLDLRSNQKSVSNDENILPFVHTFDPAYPGLLQGVKSIISRLFTSLELKDIFGPLRIIDSRREPKNLLRIFQRSRFDELRPSSISGGVTKCGSKNCKLCTCILEVDSVLFSNSGIEFKIKSKMDCTTRNVVYALFCNLCKQSYIGETVCLRDRVNSHRTNSKSLDRAAQQVSRHFLHCSSGFKVCPILKVNQECKIARLVKEDNLVKLLKPDLNADERNLLHLNIV